MGNITEILDTAKQYMQEHGFCQGGIEDNLGRVCTMGAIGCAFVIVRETKDGRLFGPHRARARRYVYSVLEDKGWEWDIPSWNDRPETTAADAVQLMRDAANRYRVEMIDKED